MRNFNAAFVCFGSLADIASSLGHVRFAPESGQTAEASICPLCAKSGHTHCSKKHRYSITSSARAMRLGGYVETDRFGGGEVDDKLRLGGLLANCGAAGN